MKSYLIPLLVSFCFSLQNSLVAQPQKGSDYKLVDRAHIAVFIIDFPDTKPAVRALYPSMEEIRKELFDSTRFIQKYLKTMSYSKFRLTGEVFGPFTHQDGITAGNGYQENAYATIKTINIPGFQYTGYTNFVFISYNDMIPWGGCSFGKSQRTVTINNESFIIPDFVKMTVGIGPYMRDTTKNYINSFKDLFMTQIFVPLSENGSGELFFENYTGMTTFRRVFLHELVHMLGVWTHSNSRTNGVHYSFEAEIAANHDFMNFEYGNCMDMMGNSQWGTSIIGSYRDLLGWTDNGNRIKLDSYTRQNIRLNPLNSPYGFRICEIRVPYRYYSRDVSKDYIGYPATGRKNAGYFLEVRRPDMWDSTLTHPSIKHNTEGLLIMETNGWTTWILDASPSANLDYSWGSQPDLRDVALKPGMRYHDGRIDISHVEKQNDGSFTASVEVFDPSVLPSRTILSGTAVSQGTQSIVTLTWYEALHADKYFIEISKDQSFSVILKLDSTYMDTVRTISGLENNVKYFWRVRAKNGAGYGEWSNGNSFTTSVTSTVVIFNNSDETTEFDCMVSPNPNTGRFKLKLSSVRDNEFILTLVNTKGQVVERRIARSAGANYTGYYDISNIQKGIYYLIVSSAGTRVVNKVVIQ